MLKTNLNALDPIMGDRIEIPDLRLVVIGFLTIIFLITAGFDGAIIQDADALRIKDAASDIDITNLVILESVTVKDFPLCN